MADSDSMFNVQQGLGQGRLETRLRRVERGEPYKRHLANAPTDATYRRALIDSFQTDGRINLRKTQVVKKGSTPINVMDGNFGFVATSTTVTIYWDGTNTSNVFRVRRADSTVQVIPGSNITVTNLTPSTTYYYLPYFGTSSCGLGFVTGDSGSPQILFLAKTAQAAALQQRQDREALTNGYGSVTTTAGGTTTTSGGGSRRDYSDGCPRAFAEYVVESKTRGIIPVEEMIVGEHIASPHKDGWVKVRRIAIEPQEEFVLIETVSGHVVEQSPSTPQPLASGATINCNRLGLFDKLLMRDNWDGSIATLGTRFHAHGKKVVVEMEGVDGNYGREHEHHFYCSRFHPVIAVSNQLWKY